MKPLIACGAGCVDPRHDGANCGGCGVRCGPGQLCANGTCGLVCASGTNACGPACVDRSVDVLNCGACGNVCNPGERCLGGSCQLVCGPGQVPCGGECVRLATDPAHCGGCGMFCAPGQVCSQGQCASVCQSPLIACNGGTTCADPRFDPDHCGGCAQPCPAVAHASRLCLGGQCTRTECDPGFADCNGNPADGCEVTLATDLANCGFCGHNCGLGGTCGGGLCQ